ncbi:MAG TPA: lysophospholipid acyltransferase family protein [Gemmatimonadales bacterium]|nr:lysophospholipid acyltransferase family protein [Gemmatimonadales bacterium]
MIHAIGYLLTLLVRTTTGTLRLVWAILRQEPPDPGSTYDYIPRWWAGVLLEASSIEVRTVGLERIEGLGPCVYCVNHTSFVDVWALLVGLPGSLKFVAKKELFRIPIFGTALRTSGQIPIDRGDRESAIESFRATGQKLRRGHAAVVFPEGTRSRDGQLQPFKKGAFVLAIATQLPVVPVYVAGSFGLMRKGSIVPRPGHVEVRIGEPIPTEGMSYRDRDQLRRQAFEAMHALADNVDALPAVG